MLWVRPHFSKLSSFRKSLTWPFLGFEGFMPSLFHKNNLLLATMHDDFRVWKKGNNSPLVSGKNHQGYVSADINIRHNVVPAAAWNDEAIKIYDVSTGKVSSTIPLTVGAETAYDRMKSLISFNDLIVTSSSNKMICYDIRSGKVVKMLHQLKDITVDAYNDCPGYFMASYGTF